MEEDVEKTDDVNGGDSGNASEAVVDVKVYGDVEGTSLESDTQNKRRSTRVKKEVVPLHADARFQPINRNPYEKPKSIRGPPIRFVKRLKRQYKTMNLVDKDWTIAERERLLDAVSKVDHDDFASMSAIIGPSKTEAEIRDYIRRIRFKAKERPAFVEDSGTPDLLFGERPQPHSSHLTVNERGDPIERWLRVIDHLVADNETPDYSKGLASVLSIIANFEQEQEVGKLGTDEDVDANPNAVAPINFKLIYDYLYALLRGFTPPELDPIEAWVILDLISETASELKHSDLDPQKEFLRNIFRDFCLKVFNTRWSSTTKLGLGAVEEEAVRKRRRKEEKAFRDYLARGNVVCAEDDDEDDITNELNDTGSVEEALSARPSLKAMAASPSRRSVAKMAASPSRRSSEQIATSTSRLSSGSILASPSQKFKEKTAASPSRRPSEEMAESPSRRSKEQTVKSPSRRCSTLEMSAESSEAGVSGEPSAGNSEGTSSQSNGDLRDEETLRLSSKYHHIMIGGLQFAKDAEDLGSLFPFNPLGIPLSVLKPKSRKS